MTTTLGRRGLAAGAAALLPAAAMIGRAQAQGAAESTFDRVRRTKVLRIAALPGELPYFQKDLATGEWSGACIDMAKDIAKVFDAKLAYVESTYGNSVLDLQSNKVDLAFALNPTPARALAIGVHPSDDHPSVRLPGEAGARTRRRGTTSTSRRSASSTTSARCTRRRRKRYCPKAQLTGYKTRDECTLALQSGRADAHILAAILGLATVGRELLAWAVPSAGQPDSWRCRAACGVQREPDTRFVEVINAWLDFNRGTGQIREWLLRRAGEVRRDARPGAGAAELLTVPRRRACR